MNGKHPIDDLFARGLSDAEATPPAAVWEGIVRKRGSGHRFALLVRRYWGLGLLLLLLGGSATYALYHSSEGGNAVATTDAPQPATAARTTDAGTPAVREVAEAARPLPAEQPVPGNNNTASGTATEQASHAAPTAVPNTPATQQASAAPGRSGSTPSPSASVPSRRPKTHVSGSTAASEPGRTPERVPNKPSAAPANGASLTASTAFSTENGPLASRYTTEATLLDPSMDYFATPIQGRVVGLERPQLLGSPERNPATAHYAPPKGTWWFGVFGGAYTEDRSWAGGDQELRTALERTEVPHYPWGAGVSFGHAWPSGVHLSTGAEWIGSRYDFRHEDRIVTETTEVHNFIITLDASVLVNISDTVTTTSETTVQQQAMNRYSTLRVPLELGWQHTWRRWHYGLRGGLAMERIMQRGGYTLERIAPDVPDASGIHSVDALSGNRTTTLLAGLVGLDLGYSLSDRLVLGITPTYSKGLMRISSTPDPYTVPERLGVRVGLTYHIPHD